MSTNMVFDENGHAEQHNYSVDQIERCIVMDNPLGNKYSDDEKKKMYADLSARVDKLPELKKIIDINTIHNFDIDGTDNFARIGFIPSQLVIFDQRIKDMCRNQWWVPNPDPNAEKKFLGFMACPALSHHSSCPFFTPPCEETRNKADEADMFLSIQSILFHDVSDQVAWEFQTINKLREEIQALLGKDSVPQQFGAGPCQACLPERCLQMGDCRMPEKQTPACEAMGMPVGQLSRDFALLTGNPDWEITFIKHWGFPNQDPKLWKVTFGLLIKLPE